MFERYTEHARRTIFFARYEASTFGSPWIESEHLLLGLLREHSSLADCLLNRSNADEIRKEIEQRKPPGKYISTCVDLPLSVECKRALAFGADEAQRRHHQDIGTGHLLVGLLREEQSLGAELLRAHGVDLETARKDLGE
jgi:ATP-dependent Clp protease ATP-binding subunit ClpC